MAKYKLDYIWLDGYAPVQNLRTKCQMKDFDSFPTVEELPEWGFDGSSTLQAEGGSSDCVLKPVAVYPDIENEYGVLVLCEVMNPDGTPHITNMRATIPDDAGTWFGFEQEYFLMEDGKPYGFPATGYPEPQGEYYCGVGYANVGSIARTLVEEHLYACLHAGINHEGRSMSSTSSGTVSLLKATGTDLECTQTSQPSICVKQAVKNTSISLWLHSRRTVQSTSLLTAQTTTFVSPVSTKLSRSTSSHGV